MSSYRRRRLRRTVVAAVGLVVLQVGAAGPALAHDSLTASAPADGAEVSTSPAAVTLTFSGPVSTQFSQVTVTGPDGSAWQVGTPDVSGDTVTQPLAAQGPAGSYQVAWRVVSGDGHPISGAFSYVVTAGPASSSPPPTTGPPSAEGAAPPATSQRPAAAAASAAPAAATTPPSGTNWVPVAAVLVILVVALGIAAVASRRRVTGSGG